MSSHDPGGYNEPGPEPTPIRSMEGAAEVAPTKEPTKGQAKRIRVCLHNIDMHIDLLVDELEKQTPESTHAEIYASLGEVKAAAAQRAAILLKDVSK